MAEAFGVAGHV